MRSVSTGLFQVMIALWLIGGSSVRAQSVWNLTRGDRFSVMVNVSRQTEIQLGDSAPVVRHTSEQFELTYLVSSILPTKTVLNVSVSNASLTDKTSDTPQTSAVAIPDGFVVDIAVDADGSVMLMGTTHHFPGKRAGISPGAARAIDESFPDPVVLSWVGRPFWLTPPATLPAADANAEQPTTWDRLDAVSLGLMGHLRGVVTCTLEKHNSEDSLESGTVSAKGSFRHIAPTPGRESEGSGFVFRDVTATVDSFEANGSFQRPEGEAPQPDPANPAGNERRPWLEKLDLHWSLSGSASVVTNGQSTKCRFEQKLEHSYQLLPGFRMKRSLFLPFPDNQRIPVR